MFERYSDQAREAVELAEVEARQLGHGHLGTEHILLGIVAEGQSVAARALIAAGATLQGCRELAAEAVGEQSRVEASDHLRLTDRANRALERAARLARRRRDPRVEPAHVLISVLDVEGRAGQVLRGLTVDLAALRTAIEPGHEEPSPAVAADGAPEAAAKATGKAAGIAPPAGSAAPTGAAPRCAHCGAALADTLTYRIISAAGAGAPPKGFAVAYCSACGVAVAAQPR